MKTNLSENGGNEALYQGEKDKFQTSCRMSTSQVPRGVTVETGMEEGHAEV
jgi:hypothetical protein